MHLVVLANFAVAQPLYSVLAETPEFFLARETASTELFLLVLALGIGVPAVGLLLEAGAALVARRARVAVHLLLVTGCVAAILLQAVREFGALPADMMIVCAMALAGVVAGGYAVLRPLRTMVSVLAPAPLVFATLFVGFTPGARVALPASDAKPGRLTIERPHPVVLVVFDEFNSTLLMDEQRRVDPVRYPNLAALASEATWYRAATTVSDMTLEAVPAILTGRRPGPSRRSPTHQDHPESVFALLGNAYTIVAFEPVTRLCPHSLCPVEEGRGTLSAVGGLLSDVGLVYLQIVLPPALRRQLPTAADTWGGLAVEAVRDPVTAFRRFVRHIRSSPRPALYVLHSLLPHQPWRYLPSGRTYDLEATGFTGGGPSGDREDRWPWNEWSVVQGLQAHLLQLQMVDRLVGELLSQLKATRIYEEALVIVTADHGLSFEAGGLRRNVLPENAADIMSVPLFVKLPGQRTGVTTERNAESIDILPTIADVLGIEVPWRLDGRSLLGPPRPNSEGKAILAAADRSTLRADASLGGRWDTLGRVLELFGSGTKPDGLYRIGPYADLVGRPLDALAVSGDGAPVKLVLDGPALWADVDPQGFFVPARVKGRVVAVEPNEAPLDLAVSLNGAIRAVTRTLAWEGRVGRFSAMLPEEAFRPGENRVEVFVVTGSRVRPVLRRLARERTVSGRISRDARFWRETLVLDGATIPIVPGAVNGWVDRAEPGPVGLYLTGWAVDPAARAASRSLLVFVGGELVYAGEPDVVREDVVALFESPAVRESGFVLEVPAQSFERSEDAELRVFAISVDGRASELAYCVGCRGARPTRSIHRLR